MKAVILAVIIGCLLLGTVAAQLTVEQIVPFATWAGWVSTNLSTPAFTSGWGNAFANATNIDPQTGLKSIGQPYAVTAVIIGSGTFDTFAKNTRIGPSAGLNLSVQSLAALADNATGCIVTTGMPRTHFVSYSAAIGSALETAEGSGHLGIFSAFNTTAIATPTIATSWTNGCDPIVADNVNKNSVPDFLPEP